MRKKDLMVRLSVLKEELSLEFEERMAANNNERNELRDKLLDRIGRLEKTVTWLQTHKPDEIEMIGSNTEVFMDGGFVFPFHDNRRYVFEYIFDGVLRRSKSFIISLDENPKKCKVLNQTNGQALIEIVCGNDKKKNNIFYILLNKLSGECTSVDGVVSDLLK